MVLWIHFSYCLLMTHAKDICWIINEPRKKLRQNQNSILIVVICWYNLIIKIKIHLKCINVQYELTKPSISIKILSVISTEYHWSRTKAFALASVQNWLNGKRNFHIFITALNGNVCACDIPQWMCNVQLTCWMLPDETKRLKMNLKH